MVKQVSEDSKVSTALDHSQLYSENSQTSNQENIEIKEKKNELQKVVRDDLSCPKTEAKIIQTFKIVVYGNLLVVSKYLVYSFLTLYDFPFATFLYIAY